MGIEGDLVGGALGSSKLETDDRYILEERSDDSGDLITADGKEDEWGTRTIWR